MATGAYTSVDNREVEVARKLSSGHLRRYTRSSLTKALTGAGFVVDRRLTQAFFGENILAVCRRTAS
jgi:hypothetical protein